MKVPRMVHRWPSTTAWIIATFIVSLINLLVAVAR